MGRGSFPPYRPNGRVPPPAVSAELTRAPCARSGPIDMAQMDPIHRDAPEFVEQSVEQEILSTGIKVTDLAHHPDPLTRSLSLTLTPTLTLTLTLPTATELRLGPS